MPARAGPEIFAITPETGPAGTPVQIKGRDLKATKHVLFAVGSTAKTARFQVVSDEELQVIVPRYYRAGAAATVAVLTRSGMAVAMPASVQTIRGAAHGHSGNEPGAGFYHVLSRGRVLSAESVALIEHGGVVERSRTPAMHLVKKGGALLEFSNPNGIVFHEHDAVLGPALFNPRQTAPQRFFHVQNITASPGVGPFLYQSAPRPDPAAAPAVPPTISSVVPPAAGAGDVITLKGKGFARTTEVFFLNSQAQARSAGFRIVSDRQLEVEVPDKDAITGPQVVVVITTEGLTLTLPRNGTIRPGVARPNPGGTHWPLPQGAILWFGPGDDVPPGAGNHLFFIARGGQVGATQLGATYFVQRGGALTRDREDLVGALRLRGLPKHVTRSLARLGNGGRVYFEPGAILPEELRETPVGHETPAIVPSFFDQPFVILAGPLYRP
jgi:hypothetical protein